MASATGLPSTAFSVDTPPRRELGDFAVGCFAVAKAQGKSPAAVATEIASRFTANELIASACAAGPFVNFHLQPTAAF